MIDIKGNLFTNSVSILIDPVSSQSYVSPHIVEACDLVKSKHKQALLVKLDTGTKRRVAELAKTCLVDLNGFLT